ncbi:hypothetical protein PR002_g27429 [Phytophthora rubi]|uniref:Retrotransposon gag domain-containing protein n=1 Tax=Phytophthora rubi TaxID=129364 RepID=A0A6A3HH41_9STRA|nr:hypothetical protein PR002_g27429 [Phytophthora rubi]
MSDSNMEETTCTNKLVEPLSAEEVISLRAVLAEFQGIQAQLQNSDEKHLASAQILKENQILLQRLITQSQQASQQVNTRMSALETRISMITTHATEMRNEISLAVENINTLKDTVNKIEPGSLVFAADDLYPEWDVTGPVPDQAMDELSATELEQRVEKCLKQKETPIYSGEDTDDVEVYALNMITWYAAYGLYFKSPQVDSRVGQLMMNHTRGKAKHWLLRDYKGARTWTAMIKGMRNRFVTKAKEEDLVASFFDCKQGAKSLDAYIEEFIRLGNTDDVSEQYKMILFKKGLKSTKLRELLQVREFDSLDDLLDGARGLNPKDNDSEAVKSSSTKTTKKSASLPAEPKARGRSSQRCSATRCLETGHTADKCWALHPELKPQWLQNRERSGYNTAAVMAPPTSSDQKLWEVLSAIQADLSKIKADLN